MIGKRAMLTMGWLMLISASAFGEIVVSTDFENGSAIVNGLDQKSGSIRIRPGGDVRRGWPCWWYFRVDGIEPGQSISVDIDRTTELLADETGAGNEGKPLNPRWSQPTQAAYSIDGGKSWLQTEAGQLIDGRMRYTVKVAASSALFAWGPPFTTKDGERLIQRIVASCPFAEAFELARTRAGRPVAAVVIRAGGKPDDQRYGLWIQARQHAWESGGSWVGSGFIEWLVGSDPRAKSLRENSLVYFVPIMDVDSVATGNGGKGQVPQDHNRDWSDTPHFPEVAAAERRIQELNRAGRFDLFVDLHNPGASDKRPFYFTAPDEMLSELGRRNLERFVAASHLEINGPLPLDPKVRRTGVNYSPKWREISAMWVGANTANHVVALTLETAWDTPHSTADGYAAVGRQLGLSIERYLRDSPRK